MEDQQFKALEHLVTNLHDSTMQELKTLREDMHVGFRRLESAIGTHRDLIRENWNVTQTLMKAVAGFEERETEREQRIREMQARIKKLEEERGVA